MVQPIIATYSKPQLLTFRNNYKKHWENMQYIVLDTDLIGGEIVAWKSYRFFSFIICRISVSSFFVLGLR